MVEHGLLLTQGERRHRRYRLAELSDEERAYPLDGSITEDAVWSSFIRPVIPELSQEERDICHYGLTEMFNNAMDHSRGTEARVGVRRTTASLELTIVDDGRGIFQKIADALGLADPRQSLLELSKGKFTTDPARHTGEGIFFASRMFDRYSIRSDELLFYHSTRSDDWLVEAEDKGFQGTRVSMALLLPSTRQMKDVFSRYSSGPDEYRFSKTHVPLKLATFDDEALISRSSAKRVLSRVDRFDEVLLDFAGVRSVGQAFADEIFRVFGNEHPQIALIAINANEQVTGMIRRAQAAKDAGQPAT
jgi:anti-sigma regulatory factor (Ser/Thr protein kinase)